MVTKWSIHTPSRAPTGGTTAVFRGSGAAHDHGSAHALPGADPSVEVVEVGEAHTSHLLQCHARAVSATAIHGVGRVLVERGDLGREITCLDVDVLRLWQVSAGVLGRGAHVEHDRAWFGHGGGEVAGGHVLVGRL